MEKIGESSQGNFDEMQDVLIRTLDEDGAGTVERSEFYTFVKMLVSKDSWLSEKQKVHFAVIKDIF